MKILNTLSVISIFLLASGGAASAQETTLKKIKSLGTLKVCMAESPPMSVRNPTTGQWSGYNIKMADDLATTLGAKLELIDQSYATMIPALLSGKCEIMMAPWFATPERAQVVAFTNIYNSQGLKVLVGTNAKFNNWEELNSPSITIAVQAGTQPEVYVRKTFPQAVVKPVVADNANSIFLEVAAGRANASVTDEDTAKAALNSNLKSKIRYLQEDRVGNPSNRAYAVRPDDWTFLSFLNVWLAVSKDKYPRE